MQSRRNRESKNIMADVLDHARPVNDQAVDVSDPA
jgi:hypothetical protein